MASNIFNAKVTLIGGLYPDNEVISDGRITTLGSSPNLTAKLYQKDAEARRYRVVDVLTGCTVVESVVAGKERILFEGTSQQMIDEIGLRPEEAKVRWDATPFGCAAC